jgi:hypothetical protein
MIASAFAAMSILAATISPAARSASHQVLPVVIDAKCHVTEFYRIPLDLKLSQLSNLNIDHTRAYHNAEGSYYPEATLLVGDKVLVQIEFSDDEDPVLYQLRTSSPGAIGPRGVAIGTTLKDVQQKWPEGEFYWTQAHGPYVAFSNGTNVYFEFDPRDMPSGAFDNPPVPIQNSSGEWVTPPRQKIVPDPEKLRVTEIRITSGKNSPSCPSFERKK